MTHSSYATVVNNLPVLETPLCFYIYSVVFSGGWYFMVEKKKRNEVYDEKQIRRWHTYQLLIPWYPMSCFYYYYFYH